MAGDGLGPGVTKLPAVMVLVMWDKQVVLFHKERF